MSKHTAVLRSGMLATALAAGLITVPVSMSAHAVAAPPACPAAFPTADAVDGVTGTGYTVERGVTPEPFSATVLGRIDNGIAPGVDMIMADLSSPAINRAGGVWAGMSGSPVYTTDGRLIGAVAYGLAANSPIAGITPAAEMKKLLRLPGSAGNTKKIAVSKAVAARLAKTGDVTTAEALSGFRRLPVPMSVSGVDVGRSGKRVERLRAAFPETQLSNSAAVPGAAADPAEITPGSNFGAALSYGAVSLAGVGTTTFVCDGKAVAFGHPFTFRGDTNRMSAHTASALFVQPDGLFGPFKVANFGGVVGTVDQDRLTGIRAQLGATPSSTLVTTSLSDGTSGRQTLRTRAVARDYLSTVSLFHMLTASDKRLDGWVAGSAAITIRVSGTRAGGKPFEVRRSDHLADPIDIGWVTGLYVYDFVDQITSQPFEDINITNVTVTGSMTSTVSQYRVTSVQVKRGDRYVTPGRSISVKAGGTLSTRVALAPYRGNGSSRTATLDLRVPGRPGDYGMFTVNGGRDMFVEEEEPGAQPTSFDALLAKLRNEPRSDEITTRLDIEQPNRTLRTTKSVSLDAAVAPYQAQFDVMVIR